MTTMQLEYQKNIENARHNAAMERLQQASVDVSEKQAQASITTASANAMQAQIAAQRVAEEERHNRASEVVERTKMWADVASTAVNAAKVVASFM